ncbi:MAG: hypothetical protein H6922_00450 [Pseudomonadaceae bacterium]|nr:hypothetical protein [Pseudomonadaceae bacterium]
MDGAKPPTFGSLPGEEERENCHGHRRTRDDGHDRQKFFFYSHSKGGMGQGCGVYNPFTHLRNTGKIAEECCDKA